MPPTIIADHKIPFLRGVLEPHAVVDYLPADKITQQTIMKADGLIIRTRTKCNEALLKGTPVKYIATATIGHDHIDADYCRLAGISWSNAPGCNASSVMQYLASALAHIAMTDHKKFDNYCIGIIGAGHVGTRVMHLAKVLGMKVLISDPPRERAEGSAAFTSLYDLLWQSDIVSMHMPLYYDGFDKSFHLANTRFFDAMKPGAWFINTARGEVADTKAIKNAIKTGKLGGAIIDVWEHEPMIDHELLQLASIATPHVAGYSLDGKAMGTAMSVRALSRYFGLGLDYWYPNQIPAPAEPIIHTKEGPVIKTTINSHHNIESFVYEVFMRTYNILADSKRLKINPAKFEQLRDDYPPRREFQAYSINKQTISTKQAGLLNKLGFNRCETPRIT